MVRYDDRDRSPGKADHWRRFRSTVEVVDQPDPVDVEARVDERDDLVDRIDRGDSTALGELFEHATGAKVRSVKVTVPRPAAPAVGD